MHALILSCNTGGGHNSCAYAIKEIFDENGEYCEVKDALCFISKRVSKFMENGHIAMYRHFPWFFRWGYGLCERHPAFFQEKGCIYQFLAKGAERLYTYVTENEYDVIICTHIFPALMLSGVLKRNSLNVKTYFVATDYTCSPGVKECCLDYYFVPHENLVEEFYCKNISYEKIIVSGIPIRQQFYEHEIKEKVKFLQGIPKESRHLVIMSGSMGCGPLKPVIKKMMNKVENEQYVTVVCGNNEKLKKQLKKITGKNEHFRILGYVQDVSLLMDSADVYMTKPGGLSITEAVVKNIPMVFVNAVAGCEEYNSRFYVLNGCAKTADSVEMLTDACVELLGNKKKQIEMTLHCEKISEKNSSRQIFDYIRRSADEDR